MWGNLRGWIISAVMVALYAAVMSYIVSAAGRVTVVTTFISDVGRGAAPILSIAPASAVSLPTRSCDAAVQVRAAIDHHRTRPGEYENSSSREEPRGIALLIEAAGCSSMDLFASQPAELIQYGGSPALEELRGLGDAMLRRGLVAQTQGRADDARGYFQAAFALGEKLYRERVRFSELDLGLKLMGDAAVQMARLAESTGDSPRAAQLRQFDDARRTLIEGQIMPMRQVLHSVDAQTIGQHVGDILYLAEHAEDRMWRVEAIMASGRLRYFVGAGGTRGDQLAAGRLLRSLSDEADPAISTAARAAAGLTLEEYRMLGR
jgi:hypothetical protein